MNAAKSALLRKVSFENKYLTREGEKVDQIEFYKWIEDYVLNRQDCTIARLKLSKNLEQAKSDILKYFQALNLDKILEDRYRYCARNNLGSPAQVTKENVKIKKSGKQYNVFRYSDLIMDCEVNKKVLYDNTAAVQEIGYQPHFLVKNSEILNYSKSLSLDYMSPINAIYIYDVSKFKLTRSENSGFYKPKSKLIKEYTWKDKDEYKDLLELLRGLVVPRDPFKVFKTKA